MYMVNKRGQITIFIIIGIIIVASFIFFSFQTDLTMDSGFREDVSKIPADIIPIKNYVDNCIKSVGEDALVFIGKQGGYFELPKYSTKDYYTKTAYYFYVNKYKVPSKSKIEQEISKYMNDGLFFCVRNFVDFKESGFDIKQGRINTKTTIKENGVLFEVDFPLNIKKEESEIKIDKFINSIDNIRLNTIYNAAESITDNQMRDFSSICLSCLIDLGIENDLYIDMNRLGNDTVLFTITDFNSVINNEPYKFNFAHKYEEYSCENPPLDASADFYLDCMKAKLDEYNYSLKINEIPDLDAIINIPFVYDVDAVGFNITFSDFTSLFDIDVNTGLINFTPTEDKIGDYTIWIKAADSLGNKDFETFKLNVVNS